MRVLMVDDHQMFLQGLKQLLSVIAPALTVDTCADITQAAQRVNVFAYDLVLLDWHLADSEGGQSLRLLRDAGCVARIVVLSGDASTALIHHAIELGAAGFIPKAYSSEMMVAALDQVLQGRIFLPAAALNPQRDASTRQLQPEADPRFAGLTARQIDVYRAAARGLPNKLIARELHIAESTVKTHLTAVYAALGVHSRAEAAYQASRDGIHIA